MAIIELFSDRQKRLQYGMPDVYTYDKIPDRLRGQIRFILRELIDMLKIDRDLYENDNIVNYYNYNVEHILRKEHGLFDIDGNKNIINIFIMSIYLNDVMDVTEAYLNFYNEYAKELINSHSYGRYFPDGKYDSVVNNYEVKINELNQRFLNAGVGYQFENGKFIRIDNQFVHAEVVKPALSLLSQDIYESAQEEFMLAHEYYRGEKYEDCLTNCAKSLESVMKIICDKRGWQHDPSRDTAKRLIEAIIKNGLIPDYLENQFREILQGAITLRNRYGSHGKGVHREGPPQYLAEFMIHQTAAMILMLVRAEDALDSTAPDNSV